MQAVGQRAGRIVLSGRARRTRIVPQLDQSHQRLVEQLDDARRTNSPLIGSADAKVLDGLPLNVKLVGIDDAAGRVVGAPEPRVDHELLGERLVLHQRDEHLEELLGHRE